MRELLEDTTYPDQFGLVWIDVGGVVVVVGGAVVVVVVVDGVVVGGVVAGGDVVTGAGAGWIGGVLVGGAVVVVGAGWGRPASAIWNGRPAVILPERTTKLKVITWREKDGLGPNRTTVAVNPRRQGRTLESNMVRTGER